MITVCFMKLFSPIFVALELLLAAPCLGSRSGWDRIARSWGWDGKGLKPFLPHYHPVKPLRL